jgi:hypothetical protein
MPDFRCLLAVIGSCVPRMTATATFARLRSSAASQADLAAAPRELREAVTVPSSRYCAAEAATLTSA